MAMILVDDYGTSMGTASYDTTNNKTTIYLNCSSKTYYFNQRLTEECCMVFARSIHEYHKMLSQQEIFTKIRIAVNSDGKAKLQVIDSNNSWYDVMIVNTN